MDSSIEVQRQTHEELERLERALYTVLSRNLPTHEAQLKNAHITSELLSRIDSRAHGLNALYLDEDTRKSESQLLEGTKSDDLGEFYKRLGKIQEHYAKYPEALSMGDGFEMKLSALIEEGNEVGEDYDDYEEEDPVSLLFSGEEAYGKYLDVYANHAAYCNLKGIGKRPGYLQYLDILLLAQGGPLHRELSKETRYTKDYETYIKALHTYILSFVKRTQPLTNVDAQQREAEKDFDAKWEAGEIKDWEETSNGGKVDGNTKGEIWCSACQKHYSKQTVYDAHLTSKKHVKAVARQATSEPPPQDPNGTNHDVPRVSAPQTGTKSRLRSSALLTHLTTALLVGLVPTLNDTKSNVERRFSLTAREREQELLEQQSKPAVAPAKTTGTGADEEEEEERIYNPLKLPLGWDGKPIPYWLYKLHGLGVEYRCEICSDQVYMGRKNFDRHFQESRHAFGMRALGLPNTKHFHEITRIEDALALAERLKQEGRHEIFEQETMEELEDDEGNVYNRKTYEDLKKQGLI